MAAETRRDRLVGIERKLLVRFGADGVEPARSIPEAAHAEQLTREDVTASVHYVRFSLTADQVESFQAGPVFLASDHPEYQVEVELPPETREELLGDLRG